MNPKRRRRSREWSVVAGCVSTLVLVGSGLSMVPSDGQAQAVRTGSYAKDWNPATWWFRLRTTTYNLQTAPVNGTESDHFLFYQHYDGTIANLAGGRIAIRLGGRVANDVANDGDLPVGGSAWQVGYAEVWAHRTTALRLGRMFLQEGATGATLDGLAVVFLPSGASWIALVPSTDVVFAVTADTSLPVNTWVTNTILRIVIFNHNIISRWRIFISKLHDSH